MTGVANFIRVGELACQKNSFLRQLVATVVSCEPAKAPQEKKKKGSNGDAPAQLYDVVLSDSVLFPEGGGQPCDHGTLFPVNAEGSADAGASTGDGIPIQNVQRRGDTCVLTSPVNLAPGTVVRQEVDWPRRLDHMEHHTGQHLLTAVVERADMMHLPTISWSLTHPFCFIQVDLAEYLEAAEGSPYAKYITKDKRISSDMLQRIQDACNAAIAGGTGVRCDVFDTREAYQLEQQRREEQSAAAAAANGVEEDKFRSRGIPEDVHGPIRIITVEGVDSCTCCGTHLPSLAHLQVLHLLHQETKGTTVKLFFVTGQRAMRLFGDMYGRERQLMTALGGCRPESFVESVQRRSKDSTEAEKKLKRWALELAGHEAAKIVQDIQSSGRQVVALRRDDVDSDFFNAVRTALNAAGLQDVVLVAAWATDCSAAAAASTIVPTKDVQGQLFISGEAKERVEKVAETAKSVMTGVKGGLSKMGFRGKGSLAEWSALVTALDTLQL